MDLSQVVLKQVPKNRLIRIQSYWYRYPKLDNHIHNVEVLNPLVYFSYNKLLCEFACHNDADRISVNNKGKFEKYYLSKLKSGEFDRIVEIARKDKVKVGHLEIYFQINPDNIYGDVRIRFAEKRAGEIVGYSISSLTDDYGKFSWNGEEAPKDGSILGFWIPNKLGVPFT